MKTKNKIHCTILLLLNVSFCFGQNDLGAFKLENRGRFPVPPLTEIRQSSGLALDPDGIHFWTHNDQGNPTTSIYKFLPGTGNAAVTIVDSINIIGHENLDWEDMTKDQAGNLYLCQTGKNCNAISPPSCASKYLYKILRMPFVALNSQNTIVPDSFIFKYPLPQACNQSGSDTVFVNAEAAIFYNNFIYIFTKNIWSKKTNNCGNWNEETTYLYRVPLTNGSSSANPIVAEYVSMFHLKVSPSDTSTDYYKVIAGAINPLNNTLALVTPARVWQFRNFTGDDFFGGDASYSSFLSDTGDPAIRGYEGAEFIDNNTLYLSVDGDNGRISSINTKLFCSQVTNHLDNVPGSLRTALSCTTNGDTVVFSPSITQTDLQLSANLILNKNIYIYSINPSLKLVSQVDLPFMISIPAGKQVSIEGLSLKTFSNSTNKIIDNKGLLTLKNLGLLFMPGQSNVIRNSSNGLLNFKGVSTITSY